MIRSAAVLGAGVMGAQIAAHFANAGVPVTLLDVTREAAREGLERAQRRSSRMRSSHPSLASLIRTGGFDEDLGLRRGRLDHRGDRRAARRQAGAARARRRAARRGRDRQLEHSGIPIASIAEGRSESFRRHLLGTHFFNPPRYLHLLELIPTADTDAGRRRARSRRSPTSASARASSSAKDTPGFIGNRIALFGVVQVLRGARVAASSRSRKSTRSPARRSAARRARRSARSTSPAIDVLAHVARQPRGGFDACARVRAAAMRRRMDRRG